MAVGFVWLGYWIDCARRRGVSFEYFLIFVMGIAICWLVVLLASRQLGMAMEMQGDRPLPPV
jgi:hypothetical protein